MKALGIISTLILVVLILCATHLYVSYVYFKIGQESGHKDAVDYAFSVCSKGGALIVDGKGEKYYCQRGKSL